MSSVCAVFASSVGGLVMRKSFAFSLYFNIIANSIDVYKKIFLHVIPVHIIFSWYDTARTTSDAIAFPITGKLSKYLLRSYTKKTDRMN